MRQDGRSGFACRWWRLRSAAGAPPRPSPPILERHDLITVPAHVLKRTVATEELPPASPSLCTSIVPGAVDAICARTLQTAMDECARENSGLPLRLRAREIADSEIGIARAPGKPVVRELRRSTISVSRLVRLRARPCSGTLVDSAGIATAAPGSDAEAEREHASAQRQPPPECLSSKKARRSASGRGRCAGRSHSGPSSVTHLITTTVRNEVPPRLHESAINARGGGPGVEDRDASAAWTNPLDLFQDWIPHRHDDAIRLPLHYLFDAIPVADNA